MWEVRAYSSGAEKTDGPKLHPAQKPIAIMARCMEDSTQPGDLILDCFAGSGTGPVAAIRGGRRWIAFENKPSNYEKALRRIVLEQEQAQKNQTEQTTLFG